MQIENKKQVADIVVTIVLFFIACFIGRLCMDRFDDSWIIFNVATIGTVFIGELIWVIVRKRIFTQRKDHTAAVLRSSEQRG